MKPSKRFPVIWNRRIGSFLRIGRFPGSRFDFVTSFIRSQQAVGFWIESNSGHNSEETSMRTEDVREFLRRVPFLPIRLTLTDGRTYDIRHPELAMVGRSIVAIGIPSSNDPDPVFDRLITVSLLHIMQIKPLEATPSASVN